MRGCGSHRCHRNWGKLGTINGSQLLVMSKALGGGGAAKPTITPMLSVVNFFSEVNIIMHSFFLFKKIFLRAHDVVVFLLVAVNPGPFCHREKVNWKHSD